MAIGVHTWIAVHQLFKELPQITMKLGLTFCVLIGLILIYRSIPGWAFADIAPGYTMLRIPYHNVEPGDLLLARRSRASPEFITRGSLVLAELLTVDRRSRSEGEMVVQVVGLPGETVEIMDETFIVDGQHLDPNKCPVPEWLDKIELSTVIGKKKYFISAEYNVIARGRQLSNQDIINVSVIPQTNLIAKAFILWLPLGRRGFIREIQ